jgi:hypothetical protein
MSRTTFTGPVRSMGGFYTQGPNTVVNIPDATNTLTLTLADHAGRLLTVNDASLIITLPPIVATADAVSSGPAADPNTLNTQGASFFIFIETAATAVAITTDGTDKFVGSVLVVDTDTAGATTGYAPAASNDTINLNGTTTGGIAGSWLKITALKSLKYMVEGVLLASAAPATPFADA